MRQLLIFSFLLCSLFAQAQNNIKKTAGINYTAGVPTTSPNEASASEIAIDTTTGYIYQWHRTAGPSMAGSWRRIGQGIDVTVGGTAPAYTPFRNQSWFAINGNDELYHYSGTGTTWNLVSGGGGGATDIGYVDNGGNDVDITSSTGSGFKIITVGGIDIAEDQPGVIFLDGTNSGKTYTGGTGISVSGTVITNTLPTKWTDAGAYTYLTSTSDNVGVGMSSAPTGRFTARGAGTTSATNAATFEKSDGTRIATIRNDGRVGIGTSSPGSTLEVLNASAEQLRLTNTSGTKFTNIQTDASGHLFFENTGGSYLWGAGAPEAGELFRLGQTFTGTGAHYGMNTQFTFDPSGDVSAGLYGHQFRARYIGTKYMQNCNTFFSRTTITNTNTSNNYIAFRGYTETLSGGAANTLIGASFELDHAGTGTISSYKGFEANIASNAGVITDTYGYYCGDITVGTQTNQPYAIYCSDANARSYFAGKFIHDATNTAAGTTGNQTINKPSGTVNIAAAGTSVTVTNSLVTTSSIVVAVLRTNDATAQILNVVPANGSFTINIVACTAEVSIGFVCYN